MGSGQPSKREALLASPLAAVLIAAGFLTVCAPVATVRAAGEAGDAGADPSLTGSPCGDSQGPNADPLRPIAVGIFHGNADAILRVYPVAGHADHL